MTIAISGLPSPYQDPYTGTSADQVAFAETSIQASQASSLLSSMSDSVSISSAGMALAGLSTDLNQTVADQTALAQLGGSASSSVQAAQGSAQAQLDGGVLQGLSNPTTPSSGITSLYQAGVVGSILDSLQGSTPLLA